MDLHIYPSSFFRLSVHFPLVVLKLENLHVLVSPWPVYCVSRLLEDYMKPHKSI